MPKAYKSPLANAKRVHVNPLVLVQADDEPAHCMTLAEFLRAYRAQMTTEEVDDLGRGCTVILEPFQRPPRWQALSEDHRVGCSDPDCGYIATWALMADQQVLKYACGECRDAAAIAEAVATADTIPALDDDRTMLHGHTPVPGLGRRGDVR